MREADYFLANNHAFMDFWFKDGYMLKIIWYWESRLFNVLIQMLNLFLVERKYVVENMFESWAKDYINFKNIFQSEKILIPCVNMALETNNQGVSCYIEFSAVLMTGVCFRKRSIRYHIFLAKSYINYPLFFYTKWWLLNVAIQ